MANNPLLKQLPIERIIRSQFQPRIHFNEVKLDELAQSIKQNGLLQPIIVRPSGIHNTFEIVAGERRWRAAQRAGLQEIDCLIKSYTDKQAAAAAAIENLNRSDLNPIEESHSYRRLIEKFGYSHEEVAATVGRSRASITNSLRLLTLNPSVVDMIFNQQLTEGHGKILAGIDKQLQIKLAKLSFISHWSVRKLESVVRSLSKNAGSSKQQEIEDPNLLSLQIALSSHLGSETIVSYKNGKGHITIHFNDLEILEGIFKKLNFTPNI